LRRHGAVFIGQTTTPEFGWKAVTDSVLTGITRNPWNLQKTPGGSSGGAAVAAATGAGVFHLGTDGGGSIRVPASFTGIVGLKPTFGRVPAFPASAFGTLAHIGPMARSIADVAAMLAAMSGRDLRDWAQGAGTLDPLTETAAALEGTRIGYWAEPPCGRLDPEIARAVDGAVKMLEGQGAIIEPVALPGRDHLELFNILWFAGAAARLDAVAEDARAGIDPGFLQAAAAGHGLRAVDLIRAQGQRADFGAAMDQLLERYDCLVSPGTAVLPFGAGREWPEGSAMTRWTQWAGFSFPINLSQQPAVIVPCGIAASRLPIGLQIVGARGHDARVLAAGAAFERLRPAFCGSR
jgi:amidase/aspartyl-tRNA(Asn)/glutamyl-tRNA(Gln) amidotransferase subunit A